MSQVTDITFQDTFNWATTNSNGKKIRLKGVPIFYLIIGAVIILILIILIVYLIGRDPDEQDALDMMTDDQYLYYNEDGYIDPNDGYVDEDGYVDPNLGYIDEDDPNYEGDGYGEDDLNY